MRKQKRKRALKKTTKKTIPNPGRWGGVINTWVCAASRFCFFFRRSGCRHVTGREIRTAVWPPAGGARGGNVRFMQDNRAGQTTQWWKERFLDALCICDALCCAAQQMISLKSASAVCHNAAANKLRAWSFSKMTSLAKHPDYYKTLVFLFSLINNKQKESYPLVCVPVR